MSKDQWNQFIIENSGSFLQSFEWGEFQKSLNRKIWRIESGGLKTLVIKYDLPLLKNYLYCPRGIFLDEARRIAKKEKSIFFKIEPENNFQFSILNFQLSNKQIQPNQTIILDITKPEEEILNQMHQKTRYNIRLAQKKGVMVEQAADKKTLDIFLNLLEQTAKRDKFRTHSKNYYQKMIEILGKEDMVKLFLAKYQGQIIAANLVCFFGQTASYLHGASDYNLRNLMAPYSLQWQAILEAKKRGLKYYDFYGIDEQKWPGVTRFKRGFGGQEITFPGTFDLVFQPFWYQAYNFARRIL